MNCCYHGFIVGRAHLRKLSFSPFHPYLAPGSGVVTLLYQLGFIKQTAFLRGCLAAKSFDQREEEKPVGPNVSDASDGLRGAAIGAGARTDAALATAPNRSPADAKELLDGPSVGAHAAPSCRWFGDTDPIPKASAREPRAAAVRRRSPGDRGGWQAKLEGALADRAALGCASWRFMLGPSLVAPYRL